MEIIFNFSEMTAVVSAATALVAVIVGPIVTWRITQHQERRADERTKLQARQRRAEKFEENSARLIDLVGRFMPLSDTLALYINDDDPSKREQANRTAAGELTLIHGEISHASSQLILLCDPKIEIERHFLQVLRRISAATIKSLGNLSAGTPEPDDHALAVLLKDFVENSRQVICRWVE